MTDRIGEYEVLEVLGAGGQATTLRARADDGRVVALKVFPESESATAEREGRLLASLASPGVARFEAIVRGSWRGRPVVAIAQEFIEGVSLQQIIDEGRFVSEADIRGLARQLLTILARLHSQSPPIVHRDVKPANIIVRPDGQLFLVDFGGGMATGELGDVVGTVGYCAPEQFFGEASPATDLYGLGATLLHLSTRRHPTDFPAHDLRYDLRGRLSCGHQLEGLITALLEPSPADRPRDASAALERLDAPDDAESNAVVMISRDPDCLFVKATPRHPWGNEIGIVGLVGLSVFVGFGQVGLAVLVALGTWALLIVLLHQLYCRHLLTLTSTTWTYTRSVLGLTFKRTGAVGPGFEVRASPLNCAFHDYETVAVRMFAMHLSPADSRRIRGAIRSFLADAGGTGVRFVFDTTDEAQTVSEASVEDVVESARAR